MALPKKVKKDINISPRGIQPGYPFGYDGTTTPNRRKELSEYITEDGTFLPKSVLHEDLDGGMLDFVSNNLKASVNGKAISVIDRILTLQRWGEFSQTWRFSEKDKNVSLPFIVIVRQPDVQYGTNPSLLYTIPDRKQFHFAKVPTWDGNRKGMDVYTIPQPVPVDITYNVKIICNRMRELNVFNRVMMQTFTSRQAYTFVKGHYVPIVLQSTGDESVVDTDERRYYQQNYQLQLQGFLIDEDEFEVKPAISRALLFYDFSNEDRKRDRESLPPSNPSTVKRTVNFGTADTVKTITYDYKNNITLLRTTNVNSITFTINGVTLTGTVLVEPGDSVVITIVKTTSGQTAKVIIDEKLVR